MSRETKRDPWLPARLDHLMRVNAAEKRIETAAAAMLAEWLPAANKAVLGPWRALTAAGPPPNPDDIAKADRALEAAFAAHLAPVLEDIFGQRFAQVARDAAISDLRYREAYAAKTTLRITKISHTTREQIRELVGEAIGKGWSMQAVAKGVDALLTADGPAPRATMFAEASREEAGQAMRRMRELMAVPLESRDARWREQLDEVRNLRNRARQDRKTAEEVAHAPRTARSLTIARTEVMTALNGGTLAGMRARSAAMGRPMEKQWLSTPDARTRQTHREADGQRVGLDEPFHVGGWDLDHPGDPDAPAEETANCRCCLLEVQPGEDDPRNPRTDRAAPTPPPTLDEQVARANDLSGFTDEHLAQSLATIAAQHPLQLDRVLGELDRRQAVEEAARKAEADAARRRELADARKAAKNAEKDAEFDRLLAEGADPEQAVEQVYGISVARQRTMAAVAAMRDAGFTGRGFEQLARAAWRAEQDDRYLAAEAVTRGHLLNDLGRREHINPRDLFEGHDARAVKYASEELLQWWDDHGGRLYFNDYKASLLGKKIDTGMREEYRK